MVDVRAHVQLPPGPLHEAGGDVLRALHRLTPAVQAAGYRAVLVYDDADDDLREQGITRFVRDAIAELDLKFLVVCTKTPLTPELFPIPATSLTLDRRRSERYEFDRLLDRVLIAHGDRRDTFSEDVRESLHDLSEQTTDFTAVEYVVEMLLAHHRYVGEVGLPVLRDLLEADHVRQKRLPAVRVQGGGRLSYRRRDKTELLAQVLLRHLPQLQALVELARSSLADFDPDAFLQEAQSSEHAYWDAVMALCMTSSPLDLVSKLLTQEQIRAEIDDLGLDPKQRNTVKEEQADLLVRSLGFTLIGSPKGVTALRSAVADARALVDDGDERTTSVLKGAADQIIKHVESTLLDLLHFWATYLFASVRDLVRRYNAQRDGDLDLRRLAIEDVVMLLRFINECAEAPDSAYRLSFPDGGHPVSKGLLRQCDRFERTRTAYEGTLQSLAPAGPATDGLRRDFGKLLAAAGEVLEQVGDSHHPKVIKLTDIVFDEYKRQIFRGVDADDNEIRFAWTDSEDRKLEVAAHYFMLPQKRVSINPHIVPLAGAAAGALFDDARVYERSSGTQRLQSERLLRRVTLHPHDEVLDVGCGTGALAVEVARRVRRVVGIDVSPDMLQLAESRAQESRAANVAFEHVGLLDFEPTDRYDLVLSNSTMHWISPPDRAYERLFRLLRRGGRLGVHQGGEGTYRGLHRHAVELVQQFGYGDYFQGWGYPAWYPSAEELHELLESVGFVDVDVDPEVSDGSESPGLVRDFSVAGLQPYLHRLPETQRDAFRREFVEQASHARLDLFTHRLYATARRP